MIVKTHVGKWRLPSYIFLCLSHLYYHVVLLKFVMSICYGSICIINITTLCFRIHARTLLLTETNPLIYAIWISTLKWKKKVYTRYFSILCQFQHSTILNHESSNKKKRERNFETYYPKLMLLLFHVEPKFVYRYILYVMLKLTSILYLYLYTISFILYILVMLYVRVTYYIIIYIISYFLRYNFVDIKFILLNFTILETYFWNKRFFPNNVFRYQIEKTIGFK